MKDIKRVDVTAYIFHLALFVCTAAIVSLLICTKAYAETPEGVQIMVSLGDSYSSGEGIEPFYDQELSTSQKVQSPDWLAHRSKMSWPGMLTLPTLSGTMADNKDTYWYFGAVSGATTRNLLKSQDKTYNKDTGSIAGSLLLAPQLDYFKLVGKDETDYVTLTLGGNDADFVGIIKQAAMSCVYLETNTLADQINYKLNNFYNPGGIGSNLNKAYHDIKENAGDNAQIIVAGYPQLLDTEGAKWIFKTVAALPVLPLGGVNTVYGMIGEQAYQSAAEIVNAGVSYFNKAIESIVNDCQKEGMNISFVSVEDAFKGHEAFSKEPYINGILFVQGEDICDYIFSSAYNPISSYSIHPNDFGARVYAKCVQERINEIEDNKRTEITNNPDTNNAKTNLVLAHAYCESAANPDYYDETYYYYDEAGRVTREQNMVLQDGSTTLREYDAWGNEVLITNRDRYNIVTTGYTEKTYDAQNNLISEISFSPNGTPTTTTTKEYDDFGNVTKETFIYETQTTEMLYRYDNRNNCIWEKESVLINGETYYITERDNQYDSNNNCTKKIETVTDVPTNNVMHIVRSYEFNENNLCILESWERDGSDPMHGETHYEYECDTNGHITEKKIMTIQDGINLDWEETYNYTYDDYGNMLSETFENGDVCYYYEYLPLSEVQDIKTKTNKPLPDVDQESGIVPPDHWIEKSITPHYSIVAQPSLIIRVGPGTDYEQISGNSSIPFGTEIPELGYSDGVLNWFVTEYRGQYGWICSNYTELISGDYEKPVIYLYPEQKTKIHIELELPKGQLTCTYPQYESGWDVIAQTDGTLIDERDNRTYSYLYWEGQGDTDFDFSSGFVVRGEDTATFLQRALEIMGLLPKEYNDFIVYWLPHMQNNPYNLISFQTTAYTQKAQLHIEPEPDTLIRVFMAYKPLLEPKEIPLQVLPRMERNGFTVVEWGGICVE